jgi:hypothetical protein
VDEPKKIRVVGRLSPHPEYGEGGLPVADKLQQLVRQTPGGRCLAPVGVYRSRSHEEADEWLMKMLTRPKRGS